jgi:hypothetical protein
VNSLVAQRLRLALDMYEAGEQMLRQRLRRERPDVTPDELDAEINSWLRTRPGAATGDSPGHPSRRFD